MKIPVNKIQANPEQPRKAFDPFELQQLAESLEARGLIQPIVVEEAGDAYLLIDGERRLKAAQMAGWKEIESVVRPSRNGNGPEERLTDALVANLQRRDLNPVEEGRAFGRLLTEFGWTRIRISQEIGKSLRTVEARLKLLELDPEIQDLVASGRLFGDIKVTEALLTIPEATARIKTAQRIVISGVKLKTAIRICAQVKKLLESQSLLDDPGIPSLARAKEKTRVRKLPPAKWDMLRQVGRVPTWGAMVEAAKETCDGCALRSMASPEICRSCPAVEMLATLITLASE